MNALKRAESPTTVEWNQPAWDEIVVTMNGTLDQTSRNLVRAVVVRAITRQPQRVVVKAHGSGSFDRDANRELIASLERQARMAGVTLILATDAVI